jgi:hypothetical protein
MNIRLIQMSKIPNTYLEEFNRKYSFVGYNTVLKGFNERFPRPSQPPTAPSSAPNLIAQAQESSYFQVPSRSAVIAHSARSVTPLATVLATPTAAPTAPTPPVPKERKKKSTKKTKASKE